MSFINITNIVIHIFNQIVLYLFDVVYFIKDMLFVHPEGFEPPTTASKAGMISISLRVQYYLLYSSLIINCNIKNKIL